ncbi:MAG: adenosylmethionine--8-amino-7-oxononanoate transaminase [Candidatus Handelsmanbacteria bacterium RIFCSPLOWO2_12_FULL_64_10]|uniref:Adenosylmethionine-8-amino-7-oxononanoate aminotransferase n=1 Tax=Handelsmanbacteria sp. (strain RIFCSPLOWO2_12_FULL_64_10) TaxID=1817868 RepID=A0A1F6CTB8_HANXR|nr:MAG: adenosylmethionine--8-amino-7-oxononanoate transaminase [Candidatus Handelsmanbacteria bacterium RIFCSPLOWO2_12_FULL_64_10]
MLNDSQQLKDADRRFIWHPFTQMQDYAREEPVVIARGDGVWLEDIDGHRYLDGFASMWCNVHGHRVPEIDAAIRAQLDAVAHTTLLGLSNVPAVRLAERLVEIAPAGLTRVFYSDDGATAVEVAVKMAFQYWRQRRDPRPGKTRFVRIEASYHGDTVGAISVGGIDLFHAAYRPLLFESISVPSPYRYRCAFCQGQPACPGACGDALGRVFEGRSGEIAAVIVEPLAQAAAGMITHPPGYLREVADLCRRYDILLIADEVATGFGRTGRMFACEHEGVTPDLLCIAKGLTGGYLPLAATLTTDEVYRAFLGDYAERRTFFHGHTYTGNPLGCAAALANIELLQRPGFWQELDRKVRLLADGLRGFYDLPHVGEVRQCGFMVGIELVRDRETRAPYGWEERVGVRVCAEARGRGLLIRPLAHVIALMPPLGMGDADLRRMLDITYDSIREVTGP